VSTTVAITASRVEMLSCSCLSGSGATLRTSAGGLLNTATVLSRFDTQN